MAPTVLGVLLPLRLETRFVPPEAAGASWVLQVRVVPDAASLDRHQPLAEAAELDAVERLWRDSANDLTTEAGRAQWGRFVAKVGGAGRAAWLARRFPAVPDGGSWRIERPAQLGSGLAAGRVAGLPDTVELWLGRGGAPPVLAATLAVDQDRLLLDLPDPEADEARWWSSFAEAKLAGLGTEIELGPVRPDDIDVLLVVGLGHDDPATLFTDHRDAGVLGILPIGVPTNTVAGEPAADLARDPEAWRALLVAPGPQQGAREVGFALTGSPEALLPLPGGDSTDGPVAQAMVGALWSAVWGHGLKDVWGLGDHGFTLGLWAIENLAVQGPVPPVRIGDQPYGVLPVTSLATWTPAPGDPAVESELARILPVVRAAAAAAAEGEGTAAGADTARLLDLIGRVPSSRDYAWRWLLPLDLLHALWWTFGATVPWSSLAQWWDDRAAAVRGIGGSPARRYVPLGWAQDLPIPLVEPDNTPLTFAESVARILQVPPNVLASQRGRREVLHPWPDSLLLRLLVHALVVNAAEVARADKNDTGPLLDPVAVPDNQPTVLFRWGMSYTDAQLTGNLQSKLYDVARAAAARLAEQPVEVVERVLRATLDTASHRVDPWVTGLAWRRLRELAVAGKPAAFRLGAYGWVDSPRPRTATAPPQEFLHAPSEAQALTSAILRDRALFDADPGRWQVDLDSAGVRLAEQLAAEVRLGAHLSEVLGRAMERAVGVRADVERLRQDFPIRTEHAGRRVCDGLAVLARMRSDPTSLGLTAGQLTELGRLVEAVDTYGDLLVADAVFDVVSGRTALAARSMEAAAGLDVPPALDVLRTPRSGRSVSTTVLTALSDAAAPAAVDETTSPGLLAEPAVAAFLQSATGLPDGPAWTWQLLDGDANVTGSTSLADLGLVPVDTLSLSGEDLAAAVRAGSGAAAVAPSGDLPAHATCRRLADLLGSRPAVPADLTVDSSQPSDAAVHADLLARYAAVHAVATDLQAALVAATGATHEQQRDRLRDALRWGITPLTADEPAVGTLLARAGAALTDRLNRCPTPADGAAQSVPLLARSLAELVSPEGRLPVLSRLPLDGLPGPLAPEPPGGGLDPAWLEVVATVRAPLARLEAEQLGRRLAGAAPFSAWSNRPGDPWQADLGPDPAPEGLAPATHLIAAFGPPGALDPGGDPTRTVALGVLDSWSEVVPSSEHATQVAFHFDAPGARAPQAVLVAVPPDVDRPLDTATLVDILLETRELARARMAIPAALEDWSVAAPVTVLPVHDPGVDVHRTP